MRDGVSKEQESAPPQHLLACVKVQLPTLQNRVKAGWGARAPCGHPKRSFWLVVSSCFNQTAATLLDRVLSEASSGAPLLHRACYQCLVLKI